MKKTLLLLSLTLTISMADNQSNSVETKVKVLTNDTMVVREVRTYREARCSRTIPKNRQSREKRVNRVAYYRVQKPTTHLACSK